ncbi:PREDICTED: protein STICHEL-like 2 [Tarenaya hassleriana]|uniref:protein STICHEL-like 2 n=1 Tax=Tarenaya hassleriana TaxID=28532 RepID=UPI00053C331E|nr:PREDICTED: protein STICHEL-like 2 [Tarenaya hassleriana]XP_010555522.1 PREDICTED: protein STICHEL-like 2 [Tarenaya hassleriana]XP_010555523.1 PREDICTED: protein STICHEL-like 2 [Tarenaya hassleriana]XP_010555524.1 PREDICTED: protein STICHEL-like 2 [Tarenaya hassleriana]XP_010555525.1 PREDICTED: protein STICHEL-like 2 [Tarenaya hassleriana]
MGETGRHSVDVPITRTLVALRRVRSLRDPSTNSMSKFASLVDTDKWETGLSNGILLQFASNDEESARARVEEKGNGCGIDKLKNWIENAGFPSEAGQFSGGEESARASRSPGERFHNDLTSKGRELVCVSPVEDVDSSASVNAFSSHTETREDVSERRDRNCYRVPSMSHSSMDEDINMVDQCSRGCGMTNCWSRTPRYRGSNHSSDVEDCPLLSGNTDESPLYRNKLGKRGSKGVIPCLELPRSLSQKFRPKTFGELVGQEVAVKCLLSTIFRGRISAVYLFHGPRGTGKTSTSRIFAAALNCISPTSHSRPCGLCRECNLFISGRSRDMKEMDSGKLNRPDSLRSLIKSAHLPPVSSRFKIFVIDECQMLCQETWAALFNSLERFSRHVIFILVTSELENLPWNVVSRSQKYHFPKVKDGDISNKLAKICLDEGIDFDQGALDFIASKSDGSLRDAEIMLDQLSLLSKRITISSAYELVGVVSDEELLELLDLALSSDTSNTVIRARELMRSKIDPMQLISQLASLIMDIIAEKCRESSSEARHRFLTRHSSEEEMQKLSHALKILSDAEKNLKASKNQTTWLTVALLQLSNSDSSSITMNEFGLGSCLRSQKNTNLRSTSSSEEGESSRQLARCTEIYNGTLESAWRRVTELCRSDSLKSFLWKRGKLTSLTIDRGMAIAELEFYTPRHVSRVERSWKAIADSFQSVLGRNVEISVNLVVSGGSLPKNAKAGNLLFRFFSCSRRIMQKSSLSTRSDSEHSDSASEKLTVPDARTSTFSTCFEAEKIGKTVNALRSSEGNVLSFGRTEFRAPSHRERSAETSSRMKECNGKYHTHMDVQEMPQSEHGQQREEDSDALCWRTPLSKGGSQTHQNRSSRLIGRVLPCTSTG